VLATHGSSEPLARYLRDERSLDAEVIPSRSNESDTEEV
jgi:hypothetical protein